MTDREVQYPYRVNPAPDGTGMVLYEHWEQLDPEHLYLLDVSSTAMGMRLEPGDLILARRWGPASLPTIFNRARIDWEAAQNE